MRASMVAAVLIAGCGEEMVPVSVDDDGGSAYAAWESASGRRMEAFSLGADARNPVSDYLFVLDNSVSMNRVIDRVREGFASLDPAAFPSEARIAVMSTLPGVREPDVRGQPPRFSLHPVVASRELYLHDPGFLRLVDGEGIRALREANPAAKRKFKQPGCDAWFRPGEKNRNGVPCIVAHTQSLSASAHAEAGLTALAQLLEKNRGKTTFRPGATVNVIFVSDTHDPGVGGRLAPDLLENRPTTHELVELIHRDNAVSGVRFHAIAPETECSERWASFGPVYAEVAQGTGGGTIDVCAATDYRPLLSSAFDDGARPTSARVSLGAPASRVEDVRVDGSPVGWTLTGSDRVVELRGVPLPGRGVTPLQVEIDYTRQESAPAGRPVAPAGRLELSAGKQPVAPPMRTMRP